MLMEKEAFINVGHGGLIMCLLIFRFGECFPLFFDVDEWRKTVKIYITLVAGSTC